MYSGDIEMHEAVTGSVAHWSKYHKHCDHRAYPLRKNSAQSSHSVLHLLVINHIFEDGPLNPIHQCIQKLGQSTGNTAHIIVLCK